MLFDWTEEQLMLRDTIRKFTKNEVAPRDKWMDENGYDWDEGIYFNYWDHPIGQYYSNNINLKDEQGNFLLIQYSESYDGSMRVNGKHVRLRVKK